MPTYEYRCKECGQHVEVVQSFTDDPLTICGNCGGALRKVFSPVGVVLKGSGFYRTDNRSSRSKDGAKRKVDASAGSGSGGSGDSSSSSTSSGGSRESSSSATTSASSGDAKSA